MSQKQKFTEIFWVQKNHIYSIWKIIINFIISGAIKEENSPVIQIEWLKDTPNCLAILLASSTFYVWDCFSNNIVFLLLYLNSSISANGFSRCGKKSLWLKMLLILKSIPLIQINQPWLLDWVGFIFVRVYYSYS